jgi:DNA-binding response OmpR family regulator
MKMPHKGVVLLVEDNVQLNTANSRALRLHGYETHTAQTLSGARGLLSQMEPDVILLDVMLPDGDGVDFCAEIRGKTQAHILFLTAKTAGGDRVRGLLTGGDDYIMKPFHPAELMARIAAVMRRRRMEKAPAKALVKGGLTLDIVALQAFAEGNNLSLSPKEFALLLLFAQNEDKIMSAGYL